MAGSVAAVVDLAAVVPQDDGEGKMVNMNIKRITQHLLMADWRCRRAFPQQTLDAIEHAIKASEDMHTGEIRFVVEGALDCRPLFIAQSARERAIDVFSQLRVWDTEHNNGLLIYLLLADHAVEIVADRGINAKVGAASWEKICHVMEASFKRGEYEIGVVMGIASITQYLIEYFPAGTGNQNELSNTPVLL